MTLTPEASDLVGMVLRLQNVKFFGAYGNLHHQTTNQWQCDHCQWLEANVGEQYKKGPDRVICLNDLNSTDNNQP